ncbi:Inositol-1-monophosphatase SuhB [Nocardioides aquaticus]|uniref:inositol-phosphate phosphatase n=1 Tax=Nocardioides aquaticus TaxID=160826 RepID=A0ABX8EI68_9ACTN|nr:inositol monophosphatase family protein [Nocardioides aquaticus]QVT80205.1 Inositol-1-monophosphatase SuhB [Nocardioides aquaticus]
MSPAEVGALADLALDVAREAAALVRDRSEGVTVAATKSSDVDPVTEVDRACEELVRRRLAHARPDDAVLGEEGDDLAGTSGVRWIVDPIDGTVNFLYGLPQHAVSIAAEVTDDAGTATVVAGVVLEVPTGTEYVARPDADGVVRATRDGRPLLVRARAPLAQRLIGTGFSYDAALRARQGAALAALLPRVRDVRRLGSCALDLCLVARGSLDGYLEEGTRLWDHAAAGLVARAAGARFEVTTGVGGRELVVCGPEDGFEDLWVAVHESGFAATVAAPALGPSGTPSAGE